MRAYRGPLEGDLISVVESHNRSNDGTVVWPADYLEVVAQAARLDLI